MTIRALPEAPEAPARLRAGIQFDLAPKALDQWNPALRAAAEEGEKDNTISIYETIGFDFWTGGGVTVKRIDAALRSIGKNKDVVVNINSPGGDVFEGLAIYNRLREHKAKVTVNVLGLAASAASFIAMAGDEVRIARAAFFMVHNAWLCACGDRNFLREIADWLEPFDNTIADIYAVRTEIELAELIKQMDAETWIGGKQAVDTGWADDFLESDVVTESAENSAADLLYIRIADAALARSGIPRSERRKLLNHIKSSKQDAAGGGKPGATVTDKPRAVALDLEPLPKISFP